jgi:N-acetylneuraminate synthase
MQNSTFIIAEAGVNHNGDIELAKALIDAAVNAKVDAVKFQTWKTELIVTESAEMADYQKNNTGTIESQFQMLKKLELNYLAFIELKAYCDNKNIIFLSTADEEVSATFLNDLQDIFKIGSGELTNTPFLRHIAQFKKPIILSTGMGYLSEIEHALEILLNAGLTREQISIVHATTEYPTPMQDVNLKAMLTIQHAFPGIKIGYSDHTLGIEVAIAAVALGATIIEKHFTLDRDMPGPDHKASLEPTELTAMVSAIRNIEKALGHGRKEPTASELKNRAIVRKSLVAAAEIKSGDLFTTHNVTIMRPGTGIPPARWDEIINKTAMRDYKKGELI